MKSIRLRSIVLAFVIALPAAREAAAQDTGLVSGSVVDASGQVLPGASVTLINEATSATRTGGGHSNVVAIQLLSYL